MTRVWAVLVASLLLIGCPGNRREQDESQNSPPQTTTSTGNPQVNPERVARGNPITPPSKELPASRIPAAATQQIQVQLLEFEIRMPETIAAGHQTFHIANAGKRNHNFAIEGNGISQKLASDLPRGDTTELTVDLKPGNYVVYCPVDQHRSRGMERRITVHQ